MKSLTKLKNEARGHEQREEWDKAVAAYLQVLRIAEEGEGEVDLSLYNRVGDLYMRIGRADEGVRFYEKAADKYAEATLYNNAIALCNKALRYATDRAGLLHRLGQFSAAQGFLTDARRWFFEYSELLTRAGNAEGALDALREYAGLVGDAEVRETVARKLLKAGRTEAACSELAIAYALCRDEGRQEQAAALRTEIVQLGGPDPERANATSAGGADAAPAEADDGGATSPASWAAEPGPDDAERPGAAAEDEEAKVDAKEAAAPASDYEPTVVEMTDVVDAGPVGGLEMMHFEAPAAEELAAPEGLEPGYSGGAEEVIGTDFDLPTIADVEGFDGSIPAEDDVGGAPLPGFDLEPLGPDGHESLDVDAAMAEGTDQDAVAGIDLDIDVEFMEPDEEIEPVVDAEDDAFADAAPPLPLLEEAGAGLTPAPVEEGNEQAALADLDALHEALAADGRFAEAQRVLREAVALDPDSMPRRRRLVEYAIAGGDTGDIINAYLDLAGALEAAGMQRMADPVYERVLELDPYNDAARTALGLAGGAERQPTPASAAEAERRSATPGTTEEGFVSLRELVVEEEPAAGSTRMVAAEKEPTGNEDHDFAELLSLFRSKVAQTLAGEDATAHFDLGLAYKEMGLYAEAVSEFQVVLRAGNAPLSIYEELGQCFVAMQRPGIAVKILEQGLRHPADDLERIGMYYFLGRAWEDLGQREHARDAYERVIALDVGFADATSRVSGL